MPIPRTLDGFDVTAAVARMLDQPELWWQALGLFVEHFADWERAWQDSIGDLVREQKRVHALRSAAANVGATALSELAGVLESQLLKAQAGEMTSVPDNSRQRLLEAFRHTWLSAAAAWKADAPDSTGLVR
jgi:HPt (histidine-containing phosphotransfer) domain-containing protein